MIDNLLVQLGPDSMNSVWEGLVEALAICGFYANSEVSSVEFSGFVDTKRFGRVNLIFVFKNTKCLDFPFVKFSDERMRGLYRKHPHVNYNGRRRKRARLPRRSPSPKSPPTAASSSGKSSAAASYRACRSTCASIPATGASLEADSRAAF